MFEKIFKEPFSANVHTPSPSTQFLQQSTVPKVVGPHKETNEGANEGANEATDVMLQRSTFSLGRVSFDGIIMCPHLRKKFQGGTSTKESITKEKAATTLKTFKRNQVPSLNIFGINLLDLRR